LGVGFCLKLLNRGEGCGVARVVCCGDGLLDCLGDCFGVVGCLGGLVVVLQGLFVVVMVC